MIVAQVVAALSQKGKEYAQCAMATSPMATMDIIKNGQNNKTETKNKKRRTNDTHRSKRHRVLFAMAGRRR